jgi:hypothetical protein
MLCLIDLIRYSFACCPPGHKGVALLAEHGRLAQKIGRGSQGARVAGDPLLAQRVWGHAQLLVQGAIELGAGSSANGDGV